MSRAIRRQNMSEELAAALLAIRLEDGTWLIDNEYLRTKGTPKEIRAYVHCDHTRRVAEDGTNEPQNLWFRRIPDHLRKTREIDIPEIAKGKRYGKKYEEFQRRVLAKNDPDAHQPPECKKRSKRLPGGRGSDVKIKIGGGAVNRKTGEPIGRRR
jgi:hypothetical protein